jgi:hypothetical protein
VDGTHERRNVMTRKKKIALAAGGTVAILAATFGGVFGTNTLLADKKTRSFTLAAPTTKVVVDSDAGDVDVVAADTDRITIRQTTHWVTHEPTPTRVVDGGVLRLDDGCGGWNVFRCEADYQITVPRNLELAIDVDSGDIEVDAVAGALSLHTDSGDVRGRDLPAAHVNAKSDSGDVRLAFSTAPASVEAKSDSGNVKVELPRASYAVDADTDSGDTDVEGIVQYDLASRTVEATSDSGDVTVRGR